MGRNHTVGIVAPSSKVSAVELELGLDRIREAGFSLSVHPQCKKGYFYFAGKDSDRAQAFYDYAVDSRFSVIWCARGGYGAVRLLPHLEKMAASRGVPQKKLLVGYSDASALLEFVRTRWGWSTLHAPMPGLRNFPSLKKSEFEQTVQWIKGEKVKKPWGKLKFFEPAPKRPVEAEAVGGNLAVLSSLIGTPFVPRLRGKIVVFEDVDESLYRVDRMFQQLLMARCLEGVQAIVLGGFQNCNDHVSLTLKRGREKRLHSPRPSDLEPVRKKFTQLEALKKTFASVGECLGIPIAHGLPIGHGPGHTPIPLGARYRLNPNGSFELVHWDWLDYR